MKLIFGALAAFIFFLTTYMLLRFYMDISGTNMTPEKEREYHGIATVIAFLSTAIFIFVCIIGK